MYGPCFKPLPGMITFANRSKPFASGPTSRVRNTRIGAVIRPTRSVCWIANVFGVTSAKTNSRMVMATVEMISPAFSQWRTANDVAIVVPPIVASNVRRRTTFR